MRTPNRAALLVGLVGLASVVVWLLFAQLVVPPIIGRAYRGESLSILNGLILGRAVHPLDLYQTLWAEIARRVTAALLGLSVLGVIATRPSVQRMLDRQLGRLARDEPPDAAAIGMSPRRMRRVNQAIAVVVTGSLIAVGADIEFWPFSNYPMYSELCPAPLVLTQLFGVDEAGQEIPLRKFGYLQPLTDHRLQMALTRLDAVARRDVEVRTVLDSVLDRYRVLARDGRHDGPALTALRLYRFTWIADRGAADMMPLTQRELLLEVHAPPRP